MKIQLRITLALFFLFGMLFIPLTTLQASWQYRLTHFIFQKPIALFQKLLLENAAKNVEFSSDTLALNLLLILLFLISILLSFFIRNKKWINFSKSFITFYLIYILLKFGIDKIMGTQFYTPEPNILYTQFGKLDKDILFWNVMGLSKTYNIITGCIEILAAILLFFRKMRLVGLLLSLFVFFHILVINLSFDISVKIYSLFLISSLIFLLEPYFKPLKNIFFSEKTEVLKSPEISFVNNYFLNNWIRFFVIGLFLIQIIYPYLVFGQQKRDFFHGAYEITETIYKNDTLSNSELPYKRIFFHKEGFMIFQKQNEEMRDFNYRIYPEKKEILLTDYQQNQFTIEYKIHKEDSILEINFAGDSLKIKAKILDWERLPALKDDFHFFIDEVK